MYDDIKRIQTTDPAINRASQKKFKLHNKQIMKKIMGQTSDLATFEKRNKLNVELTAQDFDKRFDKPNRLPKLNSTRQ